MTRTSTLTVTRIGALGAAGLGILTLAGCSTAEAEPATGGDTAAGGGAVATGSYTDGTYTAEGDYISPAGPSTVTVEVTLADGILTAVDVTPQSDDSTSRGFQEKFAGGIAGEVVGKSIDSLNVSRVAGSSLTSGGFAAAIDTIKADAAS